MYLCVASFCVPSFPPLVIVCTSLKEEEEEQLERGEGSVPSREALQQRVAELSGQLQDKEASMATVTEHHKEELARLMSHVENQSRAIVELKVGVWRGW